MITISTDEFRRLIGHIQEYLDNPNLPNTMKNVMMLWFISLTSLTPV
jgi:hypothetical protein